MGCRVALLLLLSVAHVTAQPVFEDLPVDDPLQQGFQLLHEKRPRLALEYFESYLERHEQHRNARFGVASAAFELKDYDRALTILNELLLEDAHDLNALHLRALTWYHTHRFKQAIRDFEEALRLDPDEGYFHESLAWAYLCEGRPDEAGRSALRAYTLYREAGEGPSFSLVLAYLAFKTIGNQREAGKVLQFALSEMNPVNWPFPVIEFFLGNIDENELIVEVESLLQETEARTYIAVKRIWENEGDRARAKLDWVAEYGDAGVFEHTYAQVLLREISR